MDHVIELDDEIFLKDAYQIADWLENEAITRFISEGRDISQEIRASLRYMTCPIVTHLFCSGGNFYLIKHNGRSIGYLKLVDKGASQAEIVVVIGESRMWNQGFGTQAVHLAMAECFLRLRYETLVAKIMPGNDSSHHLFRKAGFERQAISGKTAVYSLKLAQYLKLAA